MVAALYAGTDNSNDMRYAVADGSYFSNYPQEAVGSVSVMVNSCSWTSKEGYFSALIRGNAVDYGSASISAVPELKTHAMLLGGLSLVGATALRRKVKQTT